MDGEFTLFEGVITLLPGMSCTVDSMQKGMPGETILVQTA